MGRVLIRKIKERERERRMMEEVRETKKESGKRKVERNVVKVLSYTKSFYDDFSLRERRGFGLHCHEKGKCHSYCSSTLRQTICDLFP